MNTEGTIFRSGFIAIVGRPNVGKSTLLNRLLDQKIAITSPRPQTTRNRIMGIMNVPDAQLVFLDTPGVHASNKKFNERMVRTALGAIGEVNAVLWLTDVTAPVYEDDDVILEALNQNRPATILVLNKIDAIPKEKLLPQMDHYRNMYDFTGLIPISALQGLGVDILVKELITLLPEGPQYFPPEMITDLSERFLVAELVREKVIRLTQQEIPYSVAVTVDSFEEKPDKRLAVISASILVERESQKGIIIGKSGAMLKEIGRLARQEIELLLGVRVFLELFVKVSRNWRQDDNKLRDLGY